MQRLQYGKKLLDNFFVTLFRQLIVDINDILFIVYKILKENYTLYELTLQKNFSLIFDSFEASIDIKLTQNCTKEFINNKEIQNDILLLKEKMLIWLNEHYHPKVLVEDVFNAISAFKYESGIKMLDIYQKIEHWIELCNELKLVIMKDYTDILESIKKSQDEFENHQLFERFFKFIDLLKKQLK